MRYYDKTVKSMSFIEYMLSDVKDERKFRRELRRLVESEGLDSQFASLLSPDTSVAKCRRELKAYSKQQEELERARLAEAERTAAMLGLSDQAKDELLNSCAFWFRKTGDGVALVFDSSSAVERNLILHGATCSVREWWADHIELSTVEDGFLLSLLSPEEEPLELSFRSAETVMRPLHAVSGIATQILQDFVSSPWAFLSEYADGVRAHIDDECANEKELRLRPLIKYLTDEDQKKPPKLFAEAAKRHGACDVLEKYASKRTKLFRVLSKQAYEPMWRELFALLEESQKGYPTLAEISVSEPDAAAHRTFVTARMHANGFTGDYPHFYKEAPFRRPRLSRSFDEVFVVGFEKYAVHHILCHMITVGERADVGELYLCGTVFRKTAGEKTDFYSCLFDRRGKTAASSITTLLLAQETDAAWQEQRRTAADTAVKTALLRPLTRAERQCKHGFLSAKGLLFGMFLFMAIFFGVFMTLGMMLIDFLTVLITTGSITLFAEQFFEVPWWLIGVLSGGLFGAAMTLLEFLQRRK